MQKIQLTHPSVSTYQDEERILEQMKNEPIWQKIVELTSTSRIKRDRMTSCCTLCVNNEKLFIKTVKTGNEEPVDRMLDLIESTFTQDQISNRDIFKKKIDGKTPLGEDRPKYKCFYVENETGKIVATRIAEQIPLKDLSGSITNKNIFYGIYIVVKPQYKGTGIARELYVSALIDALIDAYRENKSIDLIIAECTQYSENLMNAVGLKRIYFNNNTGLTEFQYKQPAIEFDVGTGEKISGEPAAHLMVCQLGEEALTKEKTKQVIISLYDQFRQTWPNEIFESKKAIQNHNEYHLSLRKMVIEEIDKNGELMLLDMKERKALETKGVQINHHFEADT